MPDKFHTSKSTVEQYEIINYFIRYRSRCFITRTPNFLKPLSKPKEKKKKILQISKTLSIRRSGVYYSKNSHENKRMSSRDESTLERIESDGFPLRRRSSWRGCPSAASRVSWKREKRKKKREKERKKASWAALISILRHFRPGSDVVAIRVALRAPSDTCHSLLPRLLKCTSSNLPSHSFSRSHLAETSCSSFPRSLLPFLLPLFLLLVTGESRSSFSYLLVTPGPRKER